MPRCGRCKETKPEAQFAKNRSRKTGLSSYCKPCAVLCTTESRTRRGLPVNKVELIDNTGQPLYWCSGIHKGKIRSLGVTCYELFCDHPAETKGLCSMHRGRYRRWGKDYSTVVRNDHDLRFWEKVDAVITPDGCWEWMGQENEFEYGIFTVGPKKYLAHRWAYERYVGPIPESLFVLHECDNPPCIRPDHLRVGTHQDNMKDMKKRGRSLVGVRNGASKITDEDVAAMRRDYSPPEVNATVLAARYSLSISHVTFILKGRRWEHVPGPLIASDQRNRYVLRGERSPVSKYTDSRIREVRRALKTHGTTEVACMFGMPVSTVSGIKHKRSRNHGS